jgi:Flp pilus assembly protein TadD
MSVTKFQRRRWPQTRNRVGSALLAAMLLLPAGCATRGTLTPEATGKGGATLGSPSTDKPAVARLADGGEGFVIRENHHLPPEAVRSFERAVVMMKNREYEQASVLLEKIVEQSPGITAPHINVAVAYVHLGKPQKAEQHLKMALGLIPGHPVASNEYGLLLRKAGRFAEARAVYEKSLVAFPDYRPARKNLGILCDLYLNDPACALGHYEMYSAAMPGDEQVKLWIADLRMRFGH